MSIRNHKDVPRHLLPEYDDYVDDALDLVRGRLSPDEETAMRQRMATDPIYKAVVDDIVDAESAPPLSPAVVEASLRNFWRKAGMQTELPARDEGSLDLEDFAARTRAREHVWRRRLVRIGAIAATVVGLMIGSWFYLASFWVSHDTPSYVTSTIELPDGSVVQLAPSSSLRHMREMKNIKGDLRRRVELDGSAEFTVTHLGGLRFEVFTTHARIVAIGTRFTVTDRADYTEVRVHEGTVTVEPLEANEASSGQPIALSAGSSARVVGGQVMTETRKTP